MIYGSPETDKERAIRKFRVIVKTWNREMRDGRSPCARLSAKAQYLGTGTYSNRATLTGLGRDEFGLTPAEVNALMHLPHFHGITSDGLITIHNGRVTFNYLNDTDDVLRELTLRKAV